MSTVDFDNCSGEDLNQLGTDLPQHFQKVFGYAVALAAASAKVQEGAGDKLYQ